MKGVAQRIGNLSLMTLALSGALSGCAGARTAGDSPAETPDSPDSGPVAESAPPAGPDCSDGTCFACGDGICPSGAYCDESAIGGPACAWLTECAGQSSCECFVEVLAADCSCSADAGGPVVDCR